MNAAEKLHRDLCHKPPEQWQEVIREAMVELQDENRRLREELQQLKDEMDDRAMEAKFNDRE